jgi:hypothetical protein
MLEFLALSALTRLTGNTVEKKGYKSRGYKLLNVGRVSGSIFCQRKDKKW